MAGLPATVGTGATAVVATWYQEVLVVVIMTRSVCVYTKVYSWYPVPPVARATAVAALHPAMLPTVWHT